MSFLDLTYNTYGILFSDINVKEVYLTIGDASISEWLGLKSLKVVIVAL